MASKKIQSTDQVAKILNSTNTSFFTGLNAEDQTSMLEVLTDYFDDANEHETGMNKMRMYIEHH